MELEVERREDRRELEPGILAGRVLPNAIERMLEFRLIGLVTPSVETGDATVCSTILPSGIV